MIQKAICCHDLSSGGQGILSAHFPQVVGQQQFRPKALLCQALALFLLLLVVSDCYGSFGSASSTVSAQPLTGGEVSLLSTMALAMILRVPLKAIAGRVLRVLLYARYSTEEQDKSSIADQFAFCRRMLSTWYDGLVEYVELSDCEMSGELVSRPGIDKAREGIQRREYDLILAEDSSRLFRNPTACGDFAESAVDAKIRIILPNDDIDTEHPDWSEDLHDAQQHHTRSNKYTRKRILRKHAALWEMGAAIGQLCPGYCRIPTKAASDGEPAEGPFYDRVDQQWAPLIVEAYERVAREEPLWAVANWLTSVSLPKAANACVPRWSDKNVLGLIRRTDHRGFQERRKSIARKLLRSGKTKQERNPDPKSVWARQMEHLRMVSDDLWYRANDVITSRITNTAQGRGSDHPRGGIPRDSRHPLSKLLVCGICGGKMYCQGRGEGGYQCEGVKKGKCWNHATALQQLVHERLGRILSREILAVADTTDALVGAVRETLQTENVEKEQLRLQTELRKNKLQQERLVQLFQMEGMDDAEVVSNKLKQLMDEKLRLAAALEAHSQTRRQLPTAAEIETRIQTLSAQLLNFSSEAGTCLSKLIVGPIRAIPFALFGGNKVVLRAEFTLQLWGILPEELYALLRRQSDAISTLTMFEPVKLLVDLFESSAVPHHALRAYALAQAMKPEEVGRELDITRRVAYQAIALGRRLMDNGLSDPYQQLSACPLNPSRWRFNREKRNNAGGDAA